MCNWTDSTLKCLLGCGHEMTWAACARLLVRSTRKWHRSQLRSHSSKLPPLNTVISPCHHVIQSDPGSASCTRPTRPSWPTWCRSFCRVLGSLVAKSPLVDRIGEGPKDPWPGPGHLLNLPLASTWIWIISFRFDFWVTPRCQCHWSHKATGESQAWEGLWDHLTAWKQAMMISHWNVNIDQTMPTHYRKSLSAWNWIVSQVHVKAVRAGGKLLPLCQAQLKKLRKHVVLMFFSRHVQLFVAQDGGPQPETTKIWEAERKNIDICLALCFCDAFTKPRCHAIVDTGTSLLGVPRQASLCCMYLDVWNSWSP